MAKQVNLPGEAIRRLRLRRVFINSPFAAAQAAGPRIQEELSFDLRPYDLDGDHPWHRLWREVSFADASTAIAGHPGGNHGVDPWRC